MKVFEAMRGNVKLFAVLAGLFLMAAMITMCTDTPSQKGNDFPVGERGMLNSGGELTPVAVDEEAFVEWTKAMAAKDAEAKTRLIGSGRILAAEIGTTVSITGMAPSGRKVEILNGSLRGRTVWVAPEYIR